MWEKKSELSDYKVAKTFIIFFIQWRKRASIHMCAMVVEMNLFTSCLCEPIEP